eukprot:CAMPEP_0175067544 /NCGR_PEP_ID=MMETSP0052_2-20121109/17161_1 /TAXON_ID=51329 ORGANISM="Polytomella parva, Strain SAG 63-3" /NCGR_SAMPLE_ID=MMETSP0052_2 /ASSEMBLY_ACC=CAM_ASM_000194 /LENGTH=745 /DNA_ID=CAMNT_0016334445 /DNA_START=205 /DNA_END=2444 /DNA_ORIENTATION=+
MSSGKDGSLPTDHNDTIDNDTEPVRTMSSLGIGDTKSDPLLIPDSAINALPNAEATTTPKIVPKRTTTDELPDNQDDNNSSVTGVYDSNPVLISSPKFPEAKGIPELKAPSRLQKAPSDAERDDENQDPPCSSTEPEVLTPRSSHPLKDFIPSKDAFLSIHTPSPLPPTLGPNKPRLVPLLAPLSSVGKEDVGLPKHQDIFRAEEVPTDPPSSGIAPLDHAPKEQVKEENDKNAAGEYPEVAEMEMKTIEATSISTHDNNSNLNNSGDNGDNTFDENGANKNADVSDSNKEDHCLIKEAESLPTPSLPPMSQSLPPLDLKLLKPSSLLPPLSQPALLSHIPSPPSYKPPPSTANGSGGRRWSQPTEKAGAVSNASAPHGVSHGDDSSRGLGQKEDGEGDREARGEGPGDKGEEVGDKEGGEEGRKEERKEEGGNKKEDEGTSEERGDKTSVSLASAFQAAADHDDAIVQAATAEPLASSSASPSLKDATILASNEEGQGMCRLNGEGNDGEGDNAMKEDDVNDGNKKESNSKNDITTTTSPPSSTTASFPTHPSTTTTTTTTQRIIAAYLLDLYHIQMPWRPLTIGRDLDACQRVQDNGALDDEHVALRAFERVEHCFILGNVVIVDPFNWLLEEEFQSPAPAPARPSSLSLPPPFSSSFSNARRFTSATESAEEEEVVPKYTAELAAAVEEDKAVENDVNSFCNRILPLDFALLRSPLSEEINSTKTSASVPAFLTLLVKTDTR